MRPVDAVVVEDPGREAVHERRHRPERDSAEGADPAGLRHARGQVAGEECSLIGPEPDAQEVGGSLNVGGVGGREPLLRIRLRGGRRVGADDAADGHDQPASLLDQLAHVPHPLGLASRQLVPDADVPLGRGRREAVVHGLVERVVVQRIVRRHLAARQRRGRCAAHGVDEGESSACEEQHRGDGHRSQPDTPPLHERWRLDLAAPCFGLALRQRRRAVRVPDARHLEQAPLALDPPQLVDAPVGEAEARAAHEVADAAGDEDLAGACQAHSPCCGMHVDPAQLPFEHLALADVDAGANLDPELA